MKSLLRAFLDYWSPKNISARIDEWTSRFRDQTGQEPDWNVERRIAKRRAESLKDNEHA